MRGYPGVREAATEQARGKQTMRPCPGIGYAEIASSSSEKGLARPGVLSSSPGNFHQTIESREGPRVGDRRGSSWCLFQSCEKRAGLDGLSGERG